MEITIALTQLYRLSRETQIALFQDIAGQQEGANMCQNEISR